jgi:hypothetical protein
MKKNTYPVADNAQAVAYREIFKDDTKPGRVKGINNSPNLVSLFPNSPFNATHATISGELDRGALLVNLTSATQTKLANDKKLSNEVIGEMFANVVDGSSARNLVGGAINPESSNDIEKIKLPHVRTQAGGDGSPGPHNYNWLYRDQKMDMNFNYLIDNQKSSPDSNSAPVGSNQPIPETNFKPEHQGKTYNDRPFYGHANLNVPSIDWNVVRSDHENKPQLQRGTGGFGSSFQVSNRAFSAQEKIGQYFTNSYVDVNNAGQGTELLDRMDKFAGKSIIDQGTMSPDNADYLGDLNPDGSKKFSG